MEPLLQSLTALCTENTRVLLSNELRTPLDTFLTAAAGTFSVEPLGISEVDNAPAGARSVSMLTAVPRG